MSGRRGVVVRFACLLVIAGVGMFIWGPLPIDHGAHGYADSRSWLGVPNAANVLVNLPIFWLAVWGWCVTRTGHWPHALRLPWQSFHLAVMAAALSAAMYHASPSNMTLAATRTCMAAAFALLALGMLAERVDPRFGAGEICASVVALVMLAGVAAASTARHEGVIDLRVLQLVETTPILLLLAGVLRMPGSHTQAQGWMITLALYAASRLFDLADSALLRVTGWISGHTLMHVSLGLVVGWMVYRAAVTRGGEAVTEASASQRQTSLNTTG